MEVQWKATAMIINRRLTTAIMYHNRLYGFRTGHGTMTAILKAKLIHQLTDMREVVLHTILLDLRKAYDALDR